MRSNLFIYATIVILIVCSPAHLQTKAESQKLAADALTLIGQKKYEEAASLIERVVKIERNTTPRDNKALGTALVNLARVKDAQNRVEVRTASMAPDASAFLRNMRVDEAIESHYSDALKAFDTLLPGEAAAWTTVVLEWGDFLHHEHGFSYKSEGYEKIVKHYSRAIDRLTGVIGPDADLTLRLVLRLADVYAKASEYESALPLYERYAKTTEARSGDRSAQIHSLRQCLAIYTLSGQTAIADATARKISQLTGNQEKLPQADLTRRTAKSYIDDMMSDPSTITTYAKTLRTQVIQIEVDEKGNVVQATTEPTSVANIQGKNVGELGLKMVRSWKFRPLSLNGTAKRMHGYVLFQYLTRKT